MIGKDKFLLGAVAGASALVIAVPLFAQLSHASPAAVVTTSTATQQSTAAVATPADTSNDKEVPDAQEAAVDPSQAKISADVAAQTATQAQPGTVHENRLDNEHGNLAYKVEITNAGNKEYDVLIDAVSGKVLKNWQDGQGRGHDEANGTEMKDANDKNEANDANGQNDKNEQESAAQTSAVSSAK